MLWLSMQERCIVLNTHGGIFANTTWKYPVPHRKVPKGWVFLANALDMPSMLAITPCSTSIAANDNDARSFNTHESYKHARTTATT